MLEMDEAKSSGDPSMTHMVCNLPCRVSDDRLVQALHEMGFEGCFDIVYIPKVTSKAGKVHNFGYGFVNFTCPDKSAIFREVFNGYRFSDFASDKVCEVRDSYIQGKFLSLHRIGRKREKVIKTRSAATMSSGSDAQSSNSPPEPRHVPPCKFAELPPGMAFQ
eukprot:TRINITY_DN64512_c0_g1_i1.p1 TRINITY_DN64512_c0_g1~~TRINITY_DN64512_c0_g1_i1.p1  ORF type:complete len:179 (+),score=27.90 TRINITY_DN64512_c0_g1_i1:51-539(+)